MPEDRPFAQTITASIEHLMSIVSTNPDFEPSTSDVLNWTYETLTDGKDADARLISRLLDLQREDGIISALTQDQLTTILGYASYWYVMTRGSYAVAECAEVFTYGLLLGHDYALRFGSLSTQVEQEGVL